MVWSGSRVEAVNSQVLGLVARAVLAAMACFFRCFRINEASHPPPQSQPHLFAPKEIEVSRNRSPLSSLFLSEEEDHASETKELQNQEFGTPDMKALKEEAQFLKACGTLPETPAEIRQVSGKVNELSTGKEKPDVSNFSSWLPGTSIEKLNLQKQPDRPLTPVNICKEWAKGSSPSVDTTSSCVFDEQSTEGNSYSLDTAADDHTSCPHTSTAISISPRTLAPNSQYRNKSVRFEFESDPSSISSKSIASDITSQNSKNSEPDGNFSVSKPSPYPTPLKLTDDMQTPGTVFPAYLDNMENGKRTRIRSQYVYPVLNPVENFSQWNLLKDEDSGSSHQSVHLRESFIQPDERNISEAKVRETSNGNEFHVETSLSSWLKQPSTNQDGDNELSSSTPSEHIRRGRMPEDRPILGMVAAHWVDDEPTHISPKRWDGNGIPNSINKYKEDQKVSWHATPFVERLEKALSEETLISQRKQISGASSIALDETDESDTALSRLQASTRNASAIPV